uniref:Complement C8 alpha chain n=1 Tax=Paramormyrops kingsleyae TaxID=1676925 RepID=A0A3B3RAH9_9TELE
MCISVFVFHVSVFSSGSAEKVTSRLTRATDTPAAIDCKIKPWSQWTPCSSCSNITSRFRYLEQASQFQGTKCLGSQWDQRACSTNVPCKPKSACGDGFTCELGRCLKKELRCNGENDCMLGSDEDGCDAEDLTENMCTDLTPIPGSEVSARGYNVLTGDFVQNAVDPEYYGGLCEYVYNGEWRRLKYDVFCENLYYNDDEKYFRKPYNFLTYRFMGYAESGGSNEFYEDAVSLLKARREGGSFNLGFTVGIDMVEVGLSGSEQSEALKNISEYKDTNLGFVRLVSRVQTAHFKLRSRDLMLDEELHRSLAELPDEYDFGAYAHVFSIHGTHYVTSGVLGGVLEYILVVDKKVMERNEITGKMAGDCFGASLGISKMGAGLSFSGTWCDKEQTSGQDKKSSGSYIKDVVNLVRGGKVQSAGGLLAVRNEETYTRWGASLKHNPQLMEFEVLPIYELVRSSTAAQQFQGKVAHLKRAWEEYLQQFNSCRCAPCRNNGLPVLQGTDCMCLCKQGYEGLACEKTQRTGPTHGGWSCWGTWSGCQSGTRRRSRQCNNPAPLNEGSPCLGTPTQTQGC